MCQRLWCWWYFLLAFKLSKNHINTVHILWFIFLLKVAQIIPYLFRFLYIARIFFFFSGTIHIKCPIPIALSGYLVYFIVSIGMQ